MTTLEIVERGTILRATVGSTVHGLHHGGQDDRDEMAIFIEPPEYLIGLRLARKQGVRNPYRTSTSSPTASASTCGWRSRDTQPCYCSCSSPTS